MLLHGRIFPAILLIFSAAISLPLCSKGLLCKCTNGTVNCQNKSGTCETMPGGACFAQNHSDISGKHWTMRKGCLDDPSSPICQMNNENGARISGCCNDTDMCNVNLLQIDPLTVDVTCNCVGIGKCDNNECVLKSAESWCYTIIRNFAGTITSQRGCTRKCKEYHNDYEMRTCCQGNKCNNETIPYTWPSVSSTVSTITPTKTSQYVPPSLIEGTPPPLVQPTTNSPDILTSEKPVTVDPQHPRQLTCYCSGCTDGSTTCLATVACASLIIESINMTWCIHDNFSCKNDSFLLNCCYKDYCNGPPQPSSGPPCDDEDMEQSGGCEFAPPTTIPPTITAPPKPTVDIAPYSASFSCSAKGMGNVKISWKREDGQALPSKAVTAVQDSGNDEMTTTGFLIISDITAYDMGKYCCVASNEAGEVTSDCAQLTVQIPPPVIEKHPEDMSVSQGTTVTFNCEATSYGDTSYLWQRVDGGKLDSSRVTGVNSNKLTITNPVPDDTGSYICIASNKDGKIVSRKADLNVQAQCLTNLTIDNGYVMFSVDSKLVAYRCFDGFRLLGSSSAECMQDGTWSSPPPECTVDSCTNIGVTNCAHFTNVDDQGNVLCMCRPGYRVDLSNSSNCIDIDECKLDDTLCDKECVNTEGSYYCQCPSLYALATNETSCIECGTSRTINDQSNHVKRKKFDWHVQLCNSSADNDYENVLCSGSLINDQWVLTSAECVCEGQDNSKLIVNVHKTTNCSKPLNNGTSRTVASVKCHEGYKSKVVGYNVALLKLSSPVNAVPVCLPKDSISMNFHEARNKVMMTGWGSSSMLRYSELYTVPNTDCKKSYGGQYDVSFNSVCTDKFNRDGHCDNGSPMMFQVKHSSSHSWLVLVGIANEACQATQPYDVYTSTTGTDIYNWIAKTTGLHI